MLIVILVLFSYAQSFTFDLTSSDINLPASSLNVSFIEDVTSKKCLLVLQYGFILKNQLMEIFKEESELIEIYNNNEPDYESLVPFLLYPKRQIDRTCLMSPQVPPFTRKEYSGPMTISGFVEFINGNCGTFRSEDGTLSPSGMLRKKLIRNLYRLQEDVGTCARIKNLSEGEFFWNYLSRSQPVVIEGGVKHWTAMSKWTSEYLRNKYHDKNVHIKLTERGEFEGVESAYVWPGYTDDKIPESVRKQLQFPDMVVVRPATAEMKFSEFIDLISVGMNKSGISAYLEYTSIPYYMPELEDDITEPSFAAALLERKHLNMWLSDGNTLGKLHFDPYDNLLCQISGEKDLVLFEPHNNENLYEAHIPEAVLGYDKKRKKFFRHSLLQSTSMVMSPVDMLKPDLERFPNFSKAKRLKCTIRPGDILFMPAFWWHEVQSIPDLKEHRNLAVNFWYEPLLTKEFPCVDCKIFFNPFYHNILLHHPPKI